jgi:hypothetical protein
MKMERTRKGAFNERLPHATKQQEPVASSPGGPQTKTGQMRSTDRSITNYKMKHKKKS